MTLRVVIADDEALVRAGLRLIIDNEPDLEVVGQAADGQQAIDVVRRARPDLVLMDVRMPHLNGLAATRALLNDDPDLSIVMLTTFGEDEYVYEALRAGASGFLLKITPPEHLVQALRTVAAGNALIDPAITRRVIEAFTHTAAPTPPPPVLADLTARELEVLRQLARGLSNREIAQALHLSEATIKTHVARVLMKLGVRDRTQAVVFAYEHGVVRPGSGSDAPSAS